MELIENLWVPIWDGKVRRYAGEETLIYEMECNEGLFKIVAANIHTTDLLFEAIFKCEPLYCVYINDKQVWYYPVVRELLTNKFGINVWERKFTIPFTVTKGDTICCELSDINIPKDFPSGHGIGCVLSSYKRVK